MAMGKRRGGETKKSLLKAMRASHAEVKPWERELQKYLLAYRSTAHTTTGVSPAECCMEGESEPKCQSLKALRGGGRETWYYRPAGTRPGC